MERPGKERRGRSRQGSAWNGRVLARHGAGVARQGFGMARHGWAWLGLTWLGAARQGMGNSLTAGRKEWGELVMAPFMPKGEIPEWQKIFQYLESVEVGDVITFEELDEWLERDFRVNRNPLYPAIRNLEREHQRTLLPVAGKGYRVAAATEHADIARGKHQRARKQMRRSVEVLESTDRSQLTNEQIARTDRLEELYRRQEESLRKQQRQLDRLERRGEATEAKVVEMTSSIDELVARLKEKGVL